MPNGRRKIISFPDAPLRPKDPIEVAKVMEWTKAVDEALHPACGFLTFLTCHRHIVLRLGEKGVEDFLSCIVAKRSDHQMFLRALDLIY